jgi:hypothetical protein
MLALSAAAIVALGPLGVVCLAAIPDKSADALASMASHIVRGKVMRIYSTVEKDADGWQFTYSVAEIRVERQEKGPPIGRVAYARFWSKQPANAADAAPGHWGHRGVLLPRQDVRAYLVEAEDGGFDALSPNGLEAPPRP